jgi:hypothetical protein
MNAGKRSAHGFLFEGSEVHLAKVAGEPDLFSSSDRESPRVLFLGMLLARVPRECSTSDSSNQAGGLLWKGGRRAQSLTANRGGRAVSALSGTARPARKAPLRKSRTATPSRSDAPPAVFQRTRETDRLGSPEPLVRLAAYFCRANSRAGPMAGTSSGTPR